MNLIFRRRKLGRTSCREVKRYMENEIEIVRNDRGLPDGELDTVFRWGCTSNLGRPAKLVVNIPDAIHRVNDKAGFRRLLNEEGLCPKTWFIEPRVWDSDLPVIVRPQHHAQGRQLYVCNSLHELRVAVRECGDSYYISELIDKVAEYRVFVIHGKVACVARKFPADENTVAWNVAQGGRFENVRWGDWPNGLCAHSLSSFALSGLDFGGVDVMVDDEGRYYTLEINSAPSLTSPYRQQCFAKCFDYIIANGVASTPPTVGDRGYRRYIHPAVIGEQNV